MGPRPAWGPAPWSPAPKPDALSLVLCLLLLGCPHGALAVPSCTEDEFPAGDQCCPKCGPGYRVQLACGESADTACVPCTPGTYTDDLNGLRKCLLCRDCDPYKGLVTRRMCSSTGNTVCGCDQGHFCVHEDGESCAECWPHSVCRPGQRVKVTGTEWQDMVCEDCPPGTFSTNGSEAECQPWSRCSGDFEVEVRPGTSSLDVTCGSRGNQSYYLVIPVICLLTFLVLYFILVRRRRKESSKDYCFRRQCAEGVTTAVQTQSDPQVQPDVTTEAVKETAPMPPEQDQAADKWIQHTEV